MAVESKFTKIVYVIFHQYYNFQHVFKETEHAVKKQVLGAVRVFR